MLPIITEETSSLLFAEIFQDVHSWRKKMIHYIKDENPEINSAIIEAANQTELDPKAVALGAYMTYKLLELASSEEQADEIVFE
ncbi:MAG: hypothetical protein PHV37_00625 [Candidatus Gastranaerophilales bacterium]|nr:hypothetical protein [Candidatus Gastranaerophilales bacterium]